MNVPIVDVLDNSGRYYDKHPLFEKVFEFLKTTDLMTLTIGKHELIKDKLFYIVAQDRARTKSVAKLEAHRIYIDIQFVISGTEQMGFRPVSQCHEIDTGYSLSKDIIFFNDKITKWLEVKEGSFAIFFPEDAHAPLVGTGEFRKIIFKISV